MDDLSLDDTMLTPPTEATGLDQFVALVRPAVRQALSGEGGANPQDLEEVLSQLLGYSLAVEKILSQAAGRAGTLPGHNVSVRAYVDQVLSGEARAMSAERLARYFKDAITFFARTHQGLEKSLDQFAMDLASAMRPSEIEDRVSASGMLKLFGLHEGAYWREYRRRFSSLDAAGIKQLAQEPDSRGSP